MKSITLFSTLALASVSTAHMLMSYPPALNYIGNPFTTKGGGDSSLTSPLKADGSDFATCHGGLLLLGTPQGQSVATWAAGGSYNFTISGGANHNGGSCQAALSYDQGKTYTVIHTVLGACPIAPSYNFKIPSDAQAGPAVFAWSWFNKVGNREMYMNCASVTITKGSTGKIKRDGAAFSSRPTLFVANIGNGCTTIEGSDLNVPNPGPDVTNNGATGGLTGTCKAVNGNGGGGGSGPPSGANSPVNAPVGSNPPASSASPIIASSIASAAPSGFATIKTSAPAAPASSIPTIPSIPSGKLTVSDDGQCSGPHTCQGSSHGGCCSQWGWCGVTDAHCGTGCQAAFGTCVLGGGSSIRGVGSFNSSTPATSRSPMAVSSIVTGTSVASQATVTSPGSLQVSGTAAPVVIITKTNTEMATATRTILVTNTVYPVTASAMSSGQGFIGYQPPTTLMTSRSTTSSPTYLDIVPTNKD